MMVTSTESKESIKSRMDEAAVHASDAISGDDVESFVVVARWWGEWYRKTGHKRLARVLLEHAALK